MAIAPQIRSSRIPLVLMAAGVLVLVAIVTTSIVLAAQTVILGADMDRARVMRTAVSTELEVLLDAETGQRGYLLTMKDSYLAPFRTSRPRAQATLQQLTAVEAGNSAMQGAMHALTSAASEKLAELEYTVALAQAGHHDEALETGTQRPRQDPDGPGARATAGPAAGCRTAGGQ